MDYPFVLFHIRTSIARHVELQNVERTFMDQSQEHELGILVVQNILKHMELGSQLGLQSQQIHLSIHVKIKELEMYAHPHFAAQRIPIGYILEYHLTKINTT
jgi:hypothetical protein